MARKAAQEAPQLTAEQKALIVAAPDEQPEAEAEPTPEEVAAQEAAQAAQKEHDDCVEFAIDAWGFPPARAERLATLTDQPVAPVATPGRIVHYHTHVGTYPAIVVKVGVNPKVVDLVIFGSPLGSCGTRQQVQQGGPGKNHTWSWPS